MRTCPACGKDTKAETSSACTHCGFSISDSAPAPTPVPSPAPQKSRGWSSTGVGWFVIIAIGIIWQVVSNLSGCEDLVSGH